MDWSLNRPWKRCSADRSEGRIGRKPTSVPSRRVTVPASGDVVSKLPPFPVIVPSPSGDFEDDAPAHVSRLEAGEDVVDRLQRLDLDRGLDATAGREIERLLQVFAGADDR